MLGIVCAVGGRGGQSQKPGWQVKGDAVRADVTQTREVRPGRGVGNHTSGAGNSEKQAQRSPGGTQTLQR